ncbi:MAG: helix-turn-helix domain-containing protein [Firmicutes bacterium]|nr:helix-turn-helix domain-containing protein [Bacillota bacterium]
MEIRIKELREERGLSQAQLAAAVGLSQNTISQYETGILEPKNKTIKKLCEYFGVTAGYLLGFEEY